MCGACGGKQVFAALAQHSDNNILQSAAHQARPGASKHPPAAQSHTRQPFWCSAKERKRDRGVGAGMAAPAYVHSIYSNWPPCTRKRPHAHMCIRIVQLSATVAVRTDSGGAGPPTAITLWVFFRKVLHNTLPSSLGTCGSRGGGRGGTEWGQEGYVCVRVGVMMSHCQLLSATALLWAWSKYVFQCQALAAPTKGLLLSEWLYNGHMTAVTAPHLMIHPAAAPVPPPG